MSRVMHEPQTTRYRAFCPRCFWIGPVRHVDSFESAPHWHAIEDGFDHDKRKHPILRLFWHWEPSSLVVIPRISPDMRPEEGLK